MSGQHLNHNNLIRAHVDGLLAWWALSGVDEAVTEEDVNWLTLQPASRPKRDMGEQPTQQIVAPAIIAPDHVAADRDEAAPTALPTESGQQSTQATVTALSTNIGRTTSLSQPSTTAPAVPHAGDVYPDTLAAFHDFLAQSAMLPETRWPGQRTAPRRPLTGTPGTAAAPQPELMIILAAPDNHTAIGSSDESTDIPLRPEAIGLMENMLRCIGISSDDCYIATLSLIAPPGGMIDSDLLAPLAKRMRHHISLVEPKGVLLVGDQVKHALSPVGDSKLTVSLPFINQAGGTVPSAAILHPRLMLEQPSAKAEAWKALRAFIRNREH